MRKLLVGLVVALALPAGANAASATWLSLDATRVAPGWTLKGSVVSSPSYDTNVVVGFTLARSVAGGGEEHALRASARSGPRRRRVSCSAATRRSARCASG